MSTTQRLPGLDDAEIEALQQAAIEYADIRDRRQKLNAYEVDLKLKLIRLMHENKKESYEYDGVKIELVTVEETVKVRVKKEEGEDDAPAPERPTELPPVDALCRLCSAPNPEFQTTDGRFYYCEAHSSDLQEGETVKRIRDSAKAAVVAESMGREPGDEPPEEETPRKDPLQEDFNARNKAGRRRKRTT